VTRAEATEVLLDACKEHMKKSIDIVISGAADGDIKHAIERARLGLLEARTFYNAAIVVIDQEFSKE
jgi:methionine aminopeptidase